MDNDDFTAYYLTDNYFGGFDFSISRDIVDCDFGLDVCESDEKICLIQRGGITFHEKAENCEAGGGSMALIYNNGYTDYTQWSLGADNLISIPVLALSLDDGSSIKQALPTTATMQMGNIGCEFVVGVI